MTGKRIGILTGGGDAPGLNGIIETVVRELSADGHTVVGIEDGFDGVFENRVIELTPSIVQGLHQKAGTMLGTSNKSSTAGRVDEFRAQFAKLKLDGLVAAGGDGTFQALGRVLNGLNIIGVPKTIDNDLAGTDMTFGFDTACAVVAESVDALRATANAHKRVMIVEAMGRTAGWIALGGGLASYADAILIPERPFSRTELTAFLKARKASGQRGCMIVASEGAMGTGEKASVAFRVPGSPQAERFGGFSEALARWIEVETGWESRHVVLGHLQRARPPTTTDRFLTLLMGHEVAQMVRDNVWNQAVVYRNGSVTRAPISDLMQPARLVGTDHKWVRVAQAMGTFI